MATLGSAHRILIVDDTPENIRILAGLLSDYPLSVATDGEQALEVAASIHRPDLILLDVMMPGLDGFEVCRRLKADPDTRDVPVIFITTQMDAEHEMKGFEVGGVDYIAKPFNPLVVRARVDTHISLLTARRDLARQNAVLEVRVAERTAQLREALAKVKDASLETTVRLARAAEYKDDDTGFHVLRMSHYAAAVARRLGLSAEDVETILHASPMHDVGKIGIPDRILLKPGKLDPDEWEIMRRHSEMGARILSGSESPMIRLAETIAWTHHEKWDGSGYPRGFKGEEIPLEGRIVAIADVFDALTTRRPYKEPFTLEKSNGILREGAGWHFDPAVVEAFFAVQDEIHAIKGRFDERS
jgi:putative two-component system response regulator